jgi:YtkA-like
VRTAHAWRAVVAAAVCATALYVLVAGSPGSTAKATGGELSARRLEAVSKRGYFVVSLESKSTPIVSGVTHDWVVTVMDANRAKVRDCSIVFDGEMPAHGHGLPTAPRITRELLPGSYLLEGVRFSMSGHWRLSVAVDRCGAHRDTAYFDLNL